MTGGITLEQNKHRSLQVPIREAELSARYYLLAEPGDLLVSEQAQVLRGQLLCLQNGRALHAPTSGKLLGFEDHPCNHESGMHQPHLVLESDGADRWRERNPWTWEQLPDDEQVFERIVQSGVVGLGGAVFPTHIKLQARRGQIHTLLLNGVECEPYITADDALMQKHPDAILRGAHLIMRICGIERCILGVEDNKPQSLEAMAVAAEQHPLPLEICALPTRYPSGGERQLIQTVLGMEVPSGGLPADLGVLCLNVATCAALADAVYEDQPSTSRITTLTGGALASPGNLKTRVGTPIHELLALAKLDHARLDRVLVGGPMMGYPLSNLAAPTGLMSNCLLAAEHGELEAGGQESPCIRCGFCVDACPAGLLPQQLFFYAKSSQYQQLQEHSLSDCIECGACAAVCPSHIPLVGYYRSAKAEIRAQQQRTLASDHARTRFESHQERIKLQKLAREQERVQRAQERKKTRDETQVVQAAMQRVETLNKPQEKRYRIALRKAEERLQELERRAEQNPQDESAADIQLVQQQIENIRTRLGESE